MDAYLGEIRIFGGTFAPNNWAFCDGSLLPISRFTALFSLLGTMYGGDGRVTFGLPNLQNSVPIGAGTGPGLTLRELGEMGGTQAETLMMTEMPAHTHSPMGFAHDGATNNPTGAVWAQSSKPSHSGPVPVNLYAATPDTTMAASALGVSGGSQPHNNMQPFLGLNFIICLNGIFPQRP